MGRGSQGLPASHRGCCRRTSDLQRAALAESVLWRREGERAGFEGRRGRGTTSASGSPLPRSSAGRRQTEAATPERPRLPGPAAPAALCSVSLGTEGRERDGKPGCCLTLARVSYSFPPTAPALLCPAGTSRWCRGSRGFSGRAPCPGTRALPRLEKPRPRGPPPSSPCCLSPPILQ